MSKLTLRNQNYLKIGNLLKQIILKIRLLYQNTQVKKRKLLKFL